MAVAVWAPDALVPLTDVARRAFRVVLDAIGLLPESDDSPSAHALDGMTLPIDLP